MAEQLDGLLVRLAEPVSRDGGTIATAPPAGAHENKGETMSKPTIYIDGEHDHRLGSASGWRRAPTSSREPAARARQGPAASWRSSTPSTW